MVLIGFTREVLICLAQVNPRQCTSIEQELTLPRNIEWRHLGTHTPMTTQSHVCEPYARIGENRCITCGDAIERVPESTESELVIAVRVLNRVTREWLDGGATIVELKSATDLVRLLMEG